ncbi:MAG: putative bifunctional diguanylate cyclase/phosphodiesterase [Gammaproteobacteria bacterium]
MVNLQTIRRSIYSVSGRLLTGTLLIHIILIPILLWMVYTLSSDSLKQQFVSNARSSAGLLATTLAPVDPIADSDIMIDLLDDIMLAGDVLYAEIALPSGQIIQNQIILNDDSLTFIEDLEFGQHKDSIYFIAVPIDFHSLDTSAALRIGYDEYALNEQLNIMFRYVSITMLSYFILSLLLVAYIGYRTTVPLNKLRNASRRIRHGHIDADLDIKSGITDVRDLARDLDLMRKELVAQASALEHQALHDSLTGLPNRVLLEDRLEQAVLTSDRHDNPFALLLMDLDHFKDVNDNLGHQAGDEVLRQVATRLNNVIRKTDTFARLGGDEFAVLLFGVKHVAVRVAKQLVDEMAHAFIVNQQPLHIGVSIGIASFPQDGESAEELMRKADIAMYEAKNSSLHYKAYTRSNDKSDPTRLTLSNDLRTAIEQNQFVIQYQPKINLKTEELEGVEALVRWNHPERGLLFPNEFINFAESSGFIIELTTHILKIAINDAARWYHEDRPIEVSVNLSPKNLLDNALPERIRGFLSDSGLPADYLSLEITENAIIQEPQHARDILLTLKDMGVRTIIDDFGTGYSSLVYLRQLPVTEIKIDKSFVIDMVHNDDDRHIVQATITMAHDLGLSVTAEGIENTITAKQLRNYNCDKGQGFLYSRGLPIDELDHWLVEYNRSLIRKVNKK